MPTNAETDVEKGLPPLFSLCSFLFGQVKSSQVKSSQIQNGGRQPAAFGAHRWRERSGGQISAQPAPLDSPESGHHPHLLLLDHRGAPGLQHRAFFRKSTVRQCNTAPGRRRERSGARARAVPMGQGVGKVWRPPAPRVECALPFSDEFWCFGPDKGPSIVFGQATRAAGAAAARVVEGVFLRCAPRPATSNLTHARAFATHRCGVDGCARGRRAAGAAEREGACSDEGIGARAAASWAARASTASSRGRRRTTAEREAEGDDEDEATDGRAPSTGQGTRGMRIRHCPPGSVS